MKSIVFILTLFGLMSLMIVSCEKDDENKNDPPAADTTSWTTDPYFFRTGKLLMNAGGIKDTFITAGLFGMSVYDTFSENPIIYSDVGCEQSVTYKPVVSFPYVLYKGPGKSALILNSPLYWRGGNGAYAHPFVFGFDFHQLDTNYDPETVVYAYSRTQPVGAFNNCNFILTATKTNSSWWNKDLALCLIQLHPVFSYAWNDIYVLDMSVTLKKIPIQSNESPNILYLGSYKDKFFASVSGNNAFNNWIIDTSGTIIAMSGLGNNFLYDVLNMNDTLYALTQWSQDLYRSFDGGQSWNIFASDFPLYYGLKLFSVQNRFCFSVYSQIAEFDLITGEIKELDNDGLQGHEITSVNEFNHKIRVTTLSGMFYRDAQHFFTYKETAMMKKGKYQFPEKIKIAGK